MHRSDPELIKACQSGDHHAWNQMIDLYGRLVYSIPRRMGFSESDADDVFASVWAAAFRNLHQLRDDTRLSAWLITTAHRECWRLKRRRPPHREFSDVDEPLHESPTDSQTERWEIQHRVRVALEQLGGRCEELLTALFLEPNDVSYETLADRLGVPIGSIGPTRARCFRKLEQIMTELGLSADLLAQHRP